jgi:hypothetical protein
MKRWLDAKRRWGRKKILIKPTEGGIIPNYFQTLCPGGNHD